MLNLIMNIHDWSASALYIKLLQNVIAASTGPVSVISFYVYVIQTNFALVDSNGWWTGLGYVAIYINDFEPSCKLSSCLAFFRHLKLRHPEIYKEYEQKRDEKSTVANKSSAAEQQLLDDISRIYDTDFNADALPLSQLIGLYPLLKPLFETVLYIPA